MRLIFTLFIFFLSFFTLSSQEKLGIANSNFSSINSVFLNPASSVDSRTLAQFNLVGANIYVMNNVGYVPKFNAWDAIRGDLPNPVLSNIKLKNFVYTKVEINGPALIVSNKEIGYGFFIRGRVEVNVSNISKELIDILLEKEVLKIDSATRNFELNIKNTRIKQMSWVEYGINFGKMYFKHGKNLIAVGGNAKYLTGINIANGHLNNISAQANQSIIKMDARASAKYNIPAWNAGKGIGIDFGITYKKTLDFVDSYFSNSQKSACRQIDYKYKVGVSLLDFGAIRFTKNTFNEVYTGNTVITDLQHTNIDSLLRADPNLKVTQILNKPILACLPTALSFQADWNLKHHFYINATIIQGLVGPRIIGVQRPNLISIAPRFEHRNIELSIPLTFHRYIYPQLGCAFRFRTFVLGMDNILPLIKKQNTYGGNIYFNLGISLFKNPACRASKPRYTPPKIQYEGYTFLTLRNKSKKTILANKQGVNPNSVAATKGNKSSNKKRGIKLFKFKRLRAKKI